METLGEGGVYPLEDKPKSKCRKWQIRVSVGADPRTGKYRQVTKTVHGTWTKANKEKVKFITSLKEIPDLPERHITLEECCELWSNPACRITQWSKNTECTYRYAMRRICGYLGKKRVDLITKNDVSKCIKEMEETLSAKTISIYIKCIASMYEQFAIEHDYAYKNPFRTAPRPSIKRRSIIALEIEEYTALVDSLISLDERPYSTAALLALCAGLRANECLDERWIDLTLGRLHVTGTKTESSDAIVPISATLQEELLSWKEQQSLIMNEMGIKQDDSTFIISRADFRKMEYHELNAWWREKRESLGLPGVHFHDLRHYFVSYCCLKDLPIEVTKKLARHSKIKTTIDVYTHLNDRFLASFVDKL